MSNDLIAPAAFPLDSLVLDILLTRSGTTGVFGVSLRAVTGRPCACLPWSG